MSRCLWGALNKCRQLRGKLAWETLVFISGIHPRHSACKKNPAVFTPKSEPVGSRISQFLKNKISFLGTYSNTRKLRGKKRLASAVRPSEGRLHNLKLLRAQSHLLPPCLWQRYHGAGSFPKLNSQDSLLTSSFNKDSSVSEDRPGRQSPLDHLWSQDEI